MRVRLVEIDVIRGAAVVLMVGYHLAVDLTWFYDWNLLGRWWVELIGWLARILFLGIVGVSMSVAIVKGKNNFVKKCLWRGFKMLAWGGVISLVTFFVFGEEGFVRWGVLHVIGFSVVFLSVLSRYMKSWYVWVGMGLSMLFVSWYLGCMQTSWLLWLVTECGHPGVDYFPVLPWMGVVSLGVGIGLFLFIVRNCIASHTFFSTDILRLHFVSLRMTDGRNLVWDRTIVVCFLLRDGLEWLGRRSLMIYLVHQPVLLVLLYFVYLVL